MPIYESRCNKCKETFEYSCGIESMYQTPVCCGTPTEKVILTPQPVFVDNPLFMTKYRKLY